MSMLRTNPALFHASDRPLARQLQSTLAGVAHLAGARLDLRSSCDGALEDHRPEPPVAGLTPVLFAHLGSHALHLSAFSAAALLSGPCPDCLAGRIQSLLPPVEQSAIHRGRRLQGDSSPYVLAGCNDLAATLATHLLQNLTTEDPRVYTLHLETGTISSFGLLPDSFCHTCAPAPDYSREASRLILRSSVPDTAGGGRVKGLQEYSFSMDALVNPTCGAVAKNTVPGEGRAVTAPTFGQYVQRSHSGHGRIVIWCGMHPRRADSRIVGVLEGLERQAGMYADPARTACVDSFTNLGGAAMDPALLLEYNDISYDLPFGLTRYSPDLPLEWIWGYSLQRQEPVLIPRQLAFYEKVTTDEVKVVQNNSSGCALGSCYEEAVLKGLLELIERDSFVIAWHKQLALPRLENKSWTSRRVRSVLDRIDLLGYDLTLLDGRLDLRLPTVIAIARRRDRELGAMSLGASTAFDIEDAICCAALEASTAVVELPVLVRSNQEHVQSLTEDYLRVVEVSDHAFLYGLPDMADRLQWMHSNPRTQTATERDSDKTWAASGDIATDLDRCLTELRRCGCPDVYVVDLTTREQRLLGLVTVRVLVPGLAPIDFGHPRHRVARLPRMQLDDELQALRTNGDRPNPLPHPFP